MATWKRAYSTDKVTQFRASVERGFRTKLSDKDVNDALQKSTNFKDFCATLKEMHGISADLDDLVKLCNKSFA
jgi:hypothetical protein